MTSTSRGRSQPITFRQQEVSYIMERWRGSESCSLVGVGSIGKSNLLQHLANPNIQGFYLKDVAANKQFRSIIIDPALLGPLPTLDTPNSEPIRCWAGYELLMHRLFLSLYPFDGMQPNDVQAFYDAYQSFQDGTNPLYAYMGLRYFELGLELLIKQGYQIVFMFDEFEEMLRQLPVKFFLTLRGLRDANKKQLSYLTFTRSPLLSIIEELGVDPLAIEPFTELFTDNMIFVGPYNESDARNMMLDLSSKSSRKHEAYALDFVLWATGRYAGLMRSSFRALDTFPELDANMIMTRADDLVQELSYKRSVRVECQTIWLSLSEKEQELLKEFMNAKPKVDPNDYETQQTYALLQQKQLLRPQNGRVTVEPPVFRAFLKAKLTEVSS